MTIVIGFLSSLITWLWTRDPSKVAPNHKGVQIQSIIYRERTTPRTELSNLSASIPECELSITT